MNRGSHRQEHLNRRTKGRESKAEKLKVDTMKTRDQVPVFQELLPQISVVGQGDQVESRENREVRGIKMIGIVKKERRSSR